MACLAFLLLEMWALNKIILETKEVRSQKVEEEGRLESSGSQKSRVWRESTKLSQQKIFGASLYPPFHSRRYLAVGYRCGGADSELS